MSLVALVSSDGRPIVVVRSLGPGKVPQTSKHLVTDAPIDRSKVRRTLCGIRLGGTTGWTWHHGWVALRLCRRCARAYREGEPIHWIDDVVRKGG